MKIQNSSESTKKQFSKAIKIETKNVMCKDGFCVIPNQDDNPSIKSIGNENLFEPI